ncbi:MAG TPA: sulfurtransferase, partial [Telluria sp.]
MKPTILPLSELPRARQLLSAHALAGMDQAACVVLEVGCGSMAAFAAGHIPGALWLDTASLETPPLYNKVSDQDLLALLLQLGIGADSTVVLYGRQPLAAARA